MEPKKVVIIGAGISGLAACKFILSKGLIPIVLEARGAIGGVWNETLKSTVLQTPKEMFRFSDFSWPKSYIRLNFRVLSIEYEGFSNEEIEGWSHWGGSGDAFTEHSKWRINVVDSRPNVPLQEVVADFVVLCIGRFSDVPNIPIFPPNEGPEAFKAGKVLLSLEYSAMDSDTATKLIKDKQVTVVGFHKSAVDLAMECANTNGPDKPCTLLYRTKHWNPPDTRPWGIPFSFLYMNRFSELLIHKPGEGFLLYLLATLLSPIKVKLAKYGMVPEQSFLQDISSCIFAGLPDKFYDKVDEGSIILKKSPSFTFCEEGVIIEGESKPVRSDLVILATEYRGDLKLRDIFASSTFRDYTMFGDLAVPMYRHCFHPRIPQVAVIGFSESNSNLYTSEIRCRWLAEFVDGTFRLPSIKEMEKDMANWEKCLKLYSGPSYKRGCIAILHKCYNDQLCKDMGWNPRRKKGFFADLFLPYGPLDYASP
ncbi:unnamed protein product [Citrullus colocynthis]|uniref:Flavin-containing monooxygenase n=1 Tax=Citrullus colocynthis TaxID=252529 RepID=A0ABP0XUA3_9ROSI